MTAAQMWDVSVFVLSTERPFSRYNNAIKREVMFATTEDGLSSSGGHGKINESHVDDALHSGCLRLLF